MARQTFISYSKKDSDFALKLAKKLEESGHRVWIDREIGGGQQWRRTIEQNLNDSNEMVVIISRNSLASRWVQHESSVAYGLDKPIIPVLIEPMPEGQSFVWMDEIQFIDFHLLGYTQGFEELKKALTPPNPVQDLLDQQLTSYKQTGDLIGEAMLAVINQERDQLVITEDAQGLIDESEKTISIRRRLLQGGIGLVVVLVLIAIAAVASLTKARVETTRARETSAAIRTLVANVETEQSVVGIAATSAAHEATTAANGFRSELEAAKSTEFAISVTQSAAQTQTADADRRLADAEASLNKIFTEFGQIPVGDGPQVLLWDGTHLWVASTEGNTVQGVDPASGRITTTLLLGQGPDGLAFDGQNLWVSSQTENKVIRYDPATGERDEYNTGEAPGELLWDGSGLWITHQNEESLWRLNPVDGTVNKIPVTGSLIALAFDGEYIWGASFSANNIQKINRETLEVENTYLVSTGPSDLLWDGESLWVASRVADLVTRIDPRNGRAVNRIVVTGGPVALAFDGANLWAATRRNDKVAFISPERNVVIAFYEVGDFPQALAWTGQDLWVANTHTNNLNRLDIHSGIVTVDLSLSDTPAAVLVINNQIWVANSGQGTIDQLDLFKGETLASYPLNGKPTALAYDGSFLWAADRDNNRVVRVADLRGRNPILILPPDDTEQGLLPADGQYGFVVGEQPVDLVFDGQFLWVANQASNTLSQIDLRTNTLVHYEDVPEPISLAFDGQYLWVASRSELAVLRFDTLDMQAAPLRIDLQGENALDLAWDGAKIWAALENGDLRAFDPQSGRGLVSYDIGARPVSLMALNGWIWAVNNTNNSVDVIDAESGQLITNVPVGNQPVSLAEGGADTLWVAIEGDRTLQSINISILNAILESLGN